MSENAADNWDLKGRTAVVTGSSSGIGRAIALRLAAAGASVLVHARKNMPAAEVTAAEIRALGVDAHILPADLADEQQRQRLVHEAFEWGEAIDIWINNAGADVLTGDAADWSFEQKLERLWQVDVTATMQLSRIVGEKMKLAGRGVILNMGWDQAEQGMAGDSGEMFGAIKGAIMAFSRSLAQSLAPDVRVNCIAPGWIRTAWGDQASDYWNDRAVGESLVGRWGTPEDVAAMAYFLASDAASFVSGQIMPVNGGFRTGAVRASDSR